MSDYDAMLQQAIQAIEQGETARAREILTRLLRVAPDNPEYWVWMSAATDSLKERRFCLQKALAVSPGYAPARRGLALMGELPPDDVPPVRFPAPYAWEAQFKPTKSPSLAFRGVHLPRKVVVGVLALFALLVFFWSGWRAWQRFRPVHVPTPQLLINVTRTPTPLPTATPTPIDFLTLGGHPTPLAMLLSATYTPTALPVSTPHLAEAYRLGMRAMNEGRWEDALRYFRQTAQAEKEAMPDIFFYIGEAYRQMDKLDSAAQAYRKALQTSPTFAPARVGLAQILLAKGEEEEALDLLQQASQDDPSYGLTYLIMARYHLDHGNPEEALVDLDNAARYLPDAALIPLYRAEAYLLLGDPQAAYDQAKEANQRDITQLSTYRLLGQAAFALGKLEDAVLYFRTYLTYAPGDAEVYRLLAEAYLKQENGEGALAAAQKLVEMKPYDAEALRLLARVYLLRGEADQAVDTLENAVQIYPNDFSLHMALTEALLAADRAGDAFHQLQTAEHLLGDKSQWYEFYYWRARVLTALDVLDTAKEDWQRVLDAPEDVIPEAWRAEAQQALDALQPTPTPTLTPTP